MTPTVNIGVLAPVIWVACGSMVVLLGEVFLSRMGILAGKPLTPSRIGSVLGFFSVATLAIAREVWNRFFADEFGVRDQEHLSIYSHMIAYGLYLPDYPIGHIIALQVAAKMGSGDFGAEFERISRLGKLTPDAWMRHAVGQPVSADALLSESRRALEALAQPTR